MNGYQEIMMNKIIKSGLLTIGLFVMVFSNVQAADFSVIDSDGDIYYIGPFLGHEIGNNKYYVEYEAGTSPFSTGEGYVYYDPYFRSLKIVIMENEDLFGFSIEGHWDGDGSDIYYVNSGGDSGAMSLFMGDRFSRSRKSKQQDRVKDIFKP